MEKHPKSIEEWAGTSKFKKFLITPWGISLISILLFSPLFLIANNKPSDIHTQISRSTHDELIKRDLIDSEFETSFLKECETTTLPRVNGSREQMAQTCECTYEAIANAALNEDKRFSTILGEIADHKREDLSCRFVE